MKFSELKVGAQFRFFRRGTLLTKVSAKEYQSGETRSAAKPEAVVLPEIEDAAEKASVDPYGASNRVEFQKGWVRLDGVFAVAQLEAVLANLKGQN